MRIMRVIMILVISEVPRGFRPRDDAVDKASGVPNALLPQVDETKALFKK